MKRINVISAFLFSICISACTGGNKQKADDCIIVDVTANYPKKEFTLQDLMDVEYIPLETTDTFTTQGVVKAIGKNLILITNRNMDGDIFVYERTTGKGQRKINRRGQGPEEYSQVNSIVLDEEHHEMFIVDYPARKILVYDLEGNFKRNFIFENTSYYHDISDYDTKYLIAYKGYSPEIENEEANHILISKQDGKVVRELSVPIKTIKTPVFIEGEMVITPGFCQTLPLSEHCILMRTSSDTIYNYSDDNIRPFIIRTPSIYTMDPEVFLFVTAADNRYYFMQTMKKEIDLNTFKGFPTNDLVYDRQEKALFECTIYNDDFTNKKEVSLKPAPGRTNNREIAACIALDASGLIEAYQKNELKGHLKEIASTLNEESNPVIMLMKYKKN